MAAGGGGPPAPGGPGLTPGDPVGLGLPGVAAGLGVAKGLGPWGEGEALPGGPPPLPLIPPRPLPRPTGKIIRLKRDR